MSLILAVAAEPNAGWGGPIALLITGAVFWAGTVIHGRWLASKNPSPTDSQKAVDGAKPQVGATGDPNGPSTAVVVRKAAGLDTFVGERMARNERTSQIMREARRVYRVSETTIKRAMRKARNGDAQ